MGAMVRKAVIPAAGLGTRFLPATIAMPKEMLPIVDKPAIQYIIEEAAASGIQDIIVVTGKSKRSIEDHFDRNLELELLLAERGKDSLLHKVREVAQLADLHYVRQREAVGLGHAIWCARKFIGDEPFAVLLGDMIIDAPVPCLKQLIDVYEQHGHSCLGVEQVLPSETEKYGIIDGTQCGERLYSVDRLVEKPMENPPTNLAISGRYILEPDIFPILERTQRDAGGEIQLTDALQMLAKHHTLLAYQYEGRLFDVGDKLGFLKATVEFATRRELLGTEFRHFLRRFVLQTEEEGDGRGENG